MIKSLVGILDFEIFFASVLAINSLNSYIKLDLLLILHIVIIILFSLILYVILMKMGTQEYRKITI